MRRLLTGGIKAILAIAALSTAAHWALRVQRDPGDAQVATTASAASAIPDPVSTGSITPRKVERAQAMAEPAAQGLDQQHLLKLISGAAPEKKPQKSVVAKR